MCGCLRLICKKKLVPMQKSTKYGLILILSLYGIVCLIYIIFECQFRGVFAGKGYFKGLVQVCYNEDIGRPCSKTSYRVSGVDFKTFTPLVGNYAKDKFNVYYASVEYPLFDS